MIHRELYFATPVYIKDVGTQEYNDYLEEKLLIGLRKMKDLRKQICMVGIQQLICIRILSINI
jgi:hypothetical protein